MRIYCDAPTVSSYSDYSFARAKYLDALDGRLLFVDDHGVDVTPEHDRHGSFVLPLRGLAQVDDSPADACGMHETGTGTSDC